MELNTIIRNLQQARRNLKHAKYKDKNILTTLYSFEDAGLYILDIVKDGIDTCKPYKTRRHLLRDLYPSCFSGFWNFGAGCLAALFAVMLIFNLAFAAWDGKGRQHSMLIAKNIVGCLAQILRGLFQIFATPLFWIRIPFRYYVFQGIRDEKFQDRKSIQQLVKDADNILENSTDQNSVSQMRFILDELQRKAIAQNNDKKQTCYKGKSSIITDGVRKITGTHKLDADFYLDNSSENISPKQVDSIKGRLSCFRVG